MARRYLSVWKQPLKAEPGGGRTRAVLIWGDPLATVGDPQDGFQKVRARGRTGWIPATAVGNRGLLEIYVIDVGQGDSVLMRTPDNRWHVVDGGVANSAQMTGKGAANFIRWKFRTDLQRPRVELENVIMTHPDFDHYGGLVNLLSGDVGDDEPFQVSVKNFYHSGIGRFRSAPRLGRSESGTVANFPVAGNGVRRSGRFITELLGGKSSFRSTALRPFDDLFAALASLVSTVPQNVSLLSRADGHLPGYAPGQSAATIGVLGPVLEEFAPGKTGLRELGDQSKTRNGHSIVLRVDYGRARILLTGDLNTRSQNLLLSYVPEDEFTVDVAKGCHHGSEDVDMGFLKAMKPRATVISSGDNEDYAHPRPVVVGASAFYGREAIDERGRILPPLLYSTELARSVRLAPAESVRIDHDNDPESGEKRFPATQTRIKAKGSAYRPLTVTPVSTDLVYGLVNIRTDGDHILCATMEESGPEFDVKVFKAGTGP